MRTYHIHLKILASYLHQAELEAFFLSERSKAKTFFQWNVIGMCEYRQLSRRDNRSSEVIWKRLQLLEE